MLTIKQVAARLAISTRTLWRMVAASRFPPPRKLSKRCARWPVSDVEQFLAGLDRQRAG